MSWLTTQSAGAPHGILLDVTGLLLAALAAPPQGRPHLLRPAPWARCVHSHWLGMGGHMGDGSLWGRFLGVAAALFAAAWVAGSVGGALAAGGGGEGHSMRDGGHGGHRDGGSGLKGNRDSRTFISLAD